MIELLEFADDVELEDELFVDVELDDELTEDVDDEDDPLDCSVSVKSSSPMMQLQQLHGSGMD